MDSTTECSLKALYQGFGKLRFVLPVNAMLASLELMNRPIHLTVAIK